MKTKFFVMAAFAAVLGFSSCSSDDGIESAPVMKNNPQGVTSHIKFNVNQDVFSGTRGTAVNAASGIADFEVWGYYNNAFTTPYDLYLGADGTAGIIIDGDNGEFDYHDAGDMKYWPSTDYPLVFTAMSPAKTSTGGEVTSITNVGGPDAAPACNGKVVANITVPTTVADQKDIMFAMTGALTSATNSGTASLTFNHALAQVVFSAKVASAQLSADITSVEIVNVKQSGTAGYADGATLTAAATGDASQTFGVGLSAATVTIDGANGGTTAANITAANGALMMLPQTVTRWATTAASPVTTATADAAHNSYLKVHCTVTNLNDNSVLIDDDDVYIPFAINWEKGNKYTYTLIFGNGTGGFDEDGNPLTNVMPISFTANVTAWTAVNGGDIAF